MRAVTHGAASRPAPGFTAVEAMVVLAIAAVLAGVGMPAMSDWLLARKAAAAADFYREGLSMARNQALMHNSASRLVLGANAGNGQPEWRVDICHPTSAARCTATSDNWAPAVARSAANLPGPDAIAVTVAPDDAQAVYFRPVGWIDMRVVPRVRRIMVAPAPARAAAFRPLAVAVTLAGIASICNPAAAAPDARACP